MPLPLAFTLNDAFWPALIVASAGGVAMVGSGRNVPLRTVWLPASATKKFPAASTATLWGYVNRAFAPMPSALP